MAADEEKQLNGAAGSKPATLHRSPNSSFKDDQVETNHISKAKLALSECEALARARANPAETPQIYLTFAPDDKDNPRNWQRWRKWYITCFASMLNVIT